MLRTCGMVVSRSQGCNGPLLGAGRRGLPQQRGPQQRGLWDSKCNRFGGVFCTPVLLMLLVFCTGSGSQPILHQPRLASSSLGTTIHLICTLSSNHNLNTYSVYWYQQRPGHPPRFLLRYLSHSDKHYGSGISPRFSGSKHVAQNQAYLSISELQPEDEAMYYCAMGVQSLQEKETEKRRGKNKIAC